MGLVGAGLALVVPESPESLEPQAVRSRAVRARVVARVRARMG